MHHHVLAVLARQVDRHVAGVLGAEPVAATAAAAAAQSRVKTKVDGPIVAKLALLVGEVYLGPTKDLDVPGGVVDCVDVEAGEGPHGVEGEVHLEGAEASVLPADPLVAWANNTTC